jgi:hypothetical protein
MVTLVPVVVNVATSEKTFVKDGMVTAIFSPASLIVPATPFREYAVITFADDGPLLPPPPLHPPINRNTQIRLISNDTNIPLAFIVSLPELFEQ